MWKIYSQAGCSYCNLAKILMMEKGIEFEEIDVRSSDEAKALFETNGFRTVPQIFTDRDVYVGGYVDLRKILI